MSIASNNPNSAPIASIAPPKVATATYESLLERLLKGELRPGQRLLETATAAAMGISPTPVREAFARLEQDGLVEILPRRGAVVSSFTATDAVELYDLRELLEIHAVRGAFARYSGPEEVVELPRLKEISLEGEAHTRAGNPMGFNRLDVEFHALMLAMSGNSRLIKLHRLLHNQVQRVRLQTVQLPGRPATAQADHRELVAAFEAWDQPLAETILSGHIRRALADLLARTDNADELEVADAE
ncbi:MAG TPA: GntR family transcriptional regulator [Galbitalea sp.]